MHPVVATRVFRHVNSGAPVTARIFAPQKIGKSTEWSCKIEVEGLEAPYERSVVGCDSFQALYLGLRVLAAHLEKHEAGLTFLDGPPGDCGLPLIVPWESGPALKANAYRLIQQTIREDLDTRRGKNSGGT